MNYVGSSCQNDGHTTSRLKYFASVYVSIILINDICRYRSFHQARDLFYIYKYLINLVPSKSLYVTTAVTLLFL